MTYHDITVNFYEIILNAIIAFGVAVGVGLYVRFKIKPKHEKIFEHNRVEEIIRIFSTIELLDIHMDELFIVFERNVGEITPTRNVVIPKPIFKLQPDGSSLATISLAETKMRADYELIKPKLVIYHNQINTLFENLREDYIRFLNNMESSFLGSVWDYMSSSTYFSEWILKDSILPSLLQKRQRSARKIIDFVNNDKSIPKDDKRIKEFIERWEMKC